VTSGYWTIQVISLYPVIGFESTDIQYGQTEYATKELALAALFDSIEINPYNEYDSFRTHLVVKQGATDLTDTTQAVFINYGKLGIFGAGGATSAVDISADSVSVTPVGGISAITVQSALAELDSEKIGDSFETVAKNIKAYPSTFSYTGEVLNTITYDLGGALSIVKTFNYTGDVLNTIVLSGDTPSGITLTKTFGYTGEQLTTLTYS